MRYLVFIGGLLILFSTAVQAETMYVSDLAEITLRTGQGIDHKIIAMIKSGQKVEVLEPADQWTRIRLPSGKEGWVVSRFLTSKLPSRIELNKLKEKHAALLALADSPYNEISKLKNANQKLKAELAVSGKTLNALKTSYETLQSKSANLLKLQANSKNSAARLSEQQKEVERLEEELSELERRQYLHWFLSGAAVLFVGFLMGYSTKRQRRRSSFL
ncbi:MAG: TIGR04211 family SH3 domain-containing protein [Candidatus Desulfatibia sp.]|uniref:TIGR04211 family SH3 domain-containing protein n=1 Tax=Candidatus Desulfatibia sp. TaxID=3101189 RepID=UPI002F345759